MEAPDCTHKSTEGWQNGSCCCNCKWHHEDFYHCCTPYPKELPEPEGCRCGIHKGWICMVSIDGEDSRAHSDWPEHSMCEMHVRKEI
jgi:hypothetical protein